MLQPLTGWLPPKRADGVLAPGENVEKPELKTTSLFYYAALKIIRMFFCFFYTVAGPDKIFSASVFS